MQVGWWGWLAMHVEDCVVHDSASIRYQSTASINCCYLPSMMCRNRLAAKSVHRCCSCGNSG